MALARSTGPHLHPLVLALLNRNFRGSDRLFQRLMRIWSLSRHKLNAPDQISINIYTPAIQGPYKGSHNHIKKRPGQTLGYCSQGFDISIICPHPLNKKHAQPCRITQPGHTRISYFRARGSGAAQTYLPAMLSETVSEARPLARRRARTLRPSFVAILSRNPCLLTRRRLEGWYVLFIFMVCVVLFLLIFGVQNYQILPDWQNFTPIFLSTHPLLDNSGSVPLFYTGCLLQFWAFFCNFALPCADVAGIRGQDKE